jgi:hypothetical protein
MDRDVEVVRRFEPLNVRQYSWWYRHGEEIGMMLWVFALTLAGATVWMSLDSTLKWFR